MTSLKGERRLETELVHAGELRPRIAGAVNAPIFQSSTFEFANEGSYHDVRYIRLNNTPNHVILHEKLARLERAEAALVTSSGMAAISATFLGLLSQGDHIIAHRSLYGGTHSFVAKDLPKLGIETTFVDADDPASWQRALRPTTRIFYIESITNPILEVVDFMAVIEFCRAKGLVSVIDNTCATPVNFRPIEVGVDLVLHSATKYLNGHSDIVAGAVMGSSGHIEAIKRKLDHLGGSLDPHACFLLHRGLKTLALRVRHQNESALQVARFLEQHPAVAKVNYPGLETHPRHARAREYFRGSGGLLSFELKGGVAAADHLFGRIELPAIAPSLGGPETLITRPATTSHAGMESDERAQQGISDALIRVSIGLEATEDLIDDFGQALDGSY
ncbi:aminotransferase class I/II-fold pyridoxal phosphate-dependent enzyme [Pendulispora brunnea]|uniref:Aminotransferase class I/II-fold pyridoxal phosphate-dependent enzyme n=1 Tax=Pendulispora brunnea TaxID=2905690 RepID=A0ABZ2K6Y3_9BACT